MCFVDERGGDTISVYNFLPFKTGFAVKFARADALVAIGAVACFTSLRSLLKKET